MTPVGTDGVDCSGDVSTCSGLRLEGKTQGVHFDVVVEQDWSERNVLGVEDGHGPFSAARSNENDIGVLPAEHWTMNMIWPRTKVTGSMTNIETSSTSTLTEGHGYRENSWGRWTFVLDGWDIAILSDKDSGVQWNWQSYHNSKSMNFLDVSFYDNDELKAIQFEGIEGELGWSHSDWSWNGEAHQCATNDATVEGANKDYYVKANIAIGDQHIPLLSNATAVTEIFVIMEWFPTISGEIRRQVDNSLVTTFAGQAGGEISFIKALITKSDSYCKYVFAAAQGNLYKESLNYKKPGECPTPTGDCWQSLKSRCQSKVGCEYVKKRWGNSFCRQDESN